MEIIRQLLQTLEVEDEQVSNKFTISTLLKLLEKQYIEIYNFLKSENINQCKLFVDKKGNVYIRSMNRALLIGNVVKYEKLLKKLERGEVEIAPVDSPSRYERVDQDVEVIDEDCEVVYEDVERIDEDAEVIIEDAEPVGKWKLVKEYPWLYPVEYEYYLKKLEEKYKILREIAQLYPATYRKYGQLLKRLVFAGAIKKCPPSINFIEKIFEKYREYR